MKKYVYKLSMIFLIILLALTIISVSYLAYFNVRIREHYENLHNTSLQKAKYELDKEIEKSLNDVEYAFATNSLPEGYYARGALEPSRSLKLTTKTTQMVKELPVSSYNIIAYREQSISKINIDQTVYIAISIKEESRIIMLLQPYEEFLSRIGFYELENVVVINEDGLIVVSLEEIAQVNLYQLVSFDGFGEISNNQKSYAKIANKDKFFVTKAISLGGFYVIGYTDVSAMNAYIDEDRKINLLYVTSIAFISFLGAFIIIMAYSSSNNKNLVGKFTRGKYSVFIDKFGRLIYKNKKFKREFSYRDIISHTFDNNEQLRQALSSNGDITLKLIDKTGTQRYLRFLSAQSFLGYRLLGTDVTEIMSDYLDALYKKNCDTLTGLPNTTQLILDYKTVLRNDLNQKSCVALIEIMGSYKCKIMFGSKFYKEVLKSFAQRLQEIFKDMVYYSGDNNFMIFTHNDQCTQYILNESTKYIALLSAPFSIENQCIKIDFKMGLSKMFYPRDRLELNVPIKQAKQIFHSIKYSQNKIWTVFFDAYMKDDLTLYEDKQAIMDLLKNDQLTLYFQPQYSIKSKKITGFEALTRIKKKTNITIAEFIELAEKNGSIIEIGTQVYQKAMAFAKKLENEKVTVSLNVSPVQLMQEGFVEKFLTEFRSLNLKRNSIAIEMTESFLVSSYDIVITKLNMLKNEGIDIHLDDFGVEYSSMLYLKKLPISVIKIDREFIRDIDTNNYSNIITDAVITLINKLKLVGIAEGVETIEQIKALTALNCDIIQGYYISKAVPEDEALKLFYEYKNKN